MKDTLSKETKLRLAKLDALEAGGVDNWEFYDDALASFRKEKQKMDRILNTIENINELLVEAEVDQPAGPGAGYAIIFDEDEMFRILEGLLQENES